MTISEGLEYRRACQEGGHLEATVTRFEMMDAFLGWWKVRKKKLGFERQFYETLTGLVKWQMQGIKESEEANTIPKP